jgi:hypothetical protein
MNILKEVTINEMNNYQRSHELLGVELIKIFNYVEPDDANLSTFGHELYQLFLRLCTEFESACKLAIRRSNLQILDKNNCIKKEKDWKITDFALLNSIQLPERDSSGCSDLNNKRGVLSEFKFYLYMWTSSRNFKPLLNFANNEGPSFYKDYNSVKHNRVNDFKKATLENVINSYLALTAVLDWQGIVINKNTGTSCGNELLFGAKFGFFWVLDSEEPSMSMKMYF